MVGVVFEQAREEWPPPGRVPEDLDIDPHVPRPRVEGQVLGDREAAADRQEEQSERQCCQVVDPTGEETRHAARVYQRSKLALRY
jgi:hypothetical protein